MGANVLAYTHENETYAWCGDACLEYRGRVSGGGGALP
jgi:hypothetical protein